MTDAPEHYVPPDGLERVPQHSTLEPVYNSTGYTQYDPQGSYAPGRMNDSKEAVHTTSDSQKELNGGQQGRICGLRKKTAIVLGAIILLLVIAGAVAGGVVGSRKKTLDPASVAVIAVPSTASSFPQTSTPTPTSTSSSAASSSSAPSIVVSQAELFDSLKFHTISTYYGSDSTITRNTTQEAKDARQFFSIIGSFPSGGTVGSVGIVQFQPQFDDQRWHIMPAKSAQVPDAALYASYGKQLSLIIITCQRYGQTVRLALNGQTPDATLTLAKQDDKQANQFWYTQQIEADIEGEYGRYALHNYQAGGDWHLGIGDESNFRKVKAPLVKGKPASDVELWQIMPREWLNETERAQWGTIV